MPLYPYGQTKPNCPPPPPNDRLPQEWMDQVQAIVNQLMASKKLLGTMDLNIEQMQKQVKIGGDGRGEEGKRVMKKQVKALSLGEHLEVI